MELRACIAYQKNLHWLGLRKAFLSKLAQEEPWKLVPWPQANSSHASICCKAFLGIYPSVSLLHLMFGETLLFISILSFVYMGYLCCKIQLKMTSFCSQPWQCWWSPSWTPCPGRMTIPYSYQIILYGLIFTWHLLHCYTHIWFTSLSLLYPLYSQNIKVLITVRTQHHHLGQTIPTENWWNIFYRWYQYC